MTTARLVPVTTEMDGDELDAEDAWHLSRRIGVRRIDHEKPARVLARTIEQLSPGGGSRDALASAVSSGQTGEWVLLAMGATGLLATYVHLSGSFGAVYGPLEGLFALLLWSLLSSVALFAGAAVCAQLELLRAGQQQPAHDDPGRPPSQVVQD
ncbi:hypothetical protein BH10ACT10_BH10ACT10_08920 [soil metagenome]